MASTSAPATSATSPRPLDWEEIGKLLSFSPREWQKAIAEAFHKSKDVQLIAPTGAGKGKLFDILLAVWPDKLFIVILPLKALEEEMASRIGPKAEYLNAEHRDSKIFDRIRSGEVGCVFLSAEMAVSKDFLRLFEDAQWRKRLGGLIFDEAHTLHDWAVQSAFREKIKELSTLRHWLGLPAVAMSGTLPAEHRASLKKYFELRNLETIDLGVNRPNLCIRIAMMQHPPSTFLDLAAYMPEVWPVGEDGIRPSPIPTIVYLNNKAKLQIMLEVVGAWYARAGYAGKVTTFHSDCSQDHKRQIKALLHAGKILCILATDAMGMGSDISVIRRVVQFGMDQSPSAVLQRLGRAGRNPRTRAEGIILVESWVKGSGVRDDNQRSSANGDLLFIVDSALAETDCIREQFNELMGQPSEVPYTDEEIFGVPLGTFSDMPCCGTCAAIEAVDIPQAFLPPPIAKPDTLPEVKVIEAKVRASLESWRIEQAEGPWKDEVADDPLGVDAFLRAADVDDIVGNVGKVAHGLRHDDSPSYFLLENFVRSRHASRVIEDVRTVVRSTLDGHQEEREQQKAEAAQRRAEAAAERAKVREKDQKAKRTAKFDEECRKKYRTAQEKFDLEGGPRPRMCDTCKNWNERNPSDSVFAYGHAKNNSLCPSKAKMATGSASAQPSGSNVTL
ncbi:hypothetical protein CF319_g1471 [Tilletia indica]|nr:hypothetical protein CF319_g1471 [Tilletia indica]